MLRPITFPARTLILKKGQTNDFLYFLREGSCKVILDGELIGRINKIGEVFGEMSVLSQDVVSADVIAATELNCFVLDARDFYYHVPPNQKDRFQFLLHKIYSAVLSKRLIATNERAKEAEIMARELAQAKNEIEAMTFAKVSFLLSSQKQNRKVLSIDSNQKNQNMARLCLGGMGIDINLAASAEEAQTNFKTEIFDVVLCSLELAPQFSPLPANWIVVSHLKVDLGKLLQVENLKFLATHHDDDQVSFTKSLLLALSKVLKQDFLGIEKYIAPEAQVLTETISRTKDRPSLSEKICDHLKSIGIRSSLLTQVQVSLEEMLMNALYDAPTDANGVALYNHLERNNQVELPDNKKVEVRYACDGVWLAVSVRDPYGSLQPKVVLKYLESCYREAAGTVEPNKGGAGRGLHQIIESNALTVFNVIPQKATEVISLWPVDRKNELPPSFHFYFS
jgi:CRP-like cAMP-binding protein